MQNIIRDIHIKSIRKGHLHLEMYTERKILNFSYRKDFKNLLFSFNKFVFEEETL